MPDDSLANKTCGEINEAGRTIQFLFGTDDKGEFLDYYATHRMTNDRHVRIYADGETVDLPTVSDMIVYPKGSTPEDEKRIEADYYAENRRVAELLKAKGFR